MWMTEGFGKDILGMGCGPESSENESVESLGADFVGKVARMPNQ